MKRSDSKEDIEAVNDSPMKKIHEKLGKANSQISKSTKKLTMARSIKDDALNELEQLLTEREQALVADRKAFELSTKRVEESVLPDRIKLDVGGRIFTVTLEMMQRYPNSYFACLVSGLWDGKKTEDGAFFINRSARLFDYIADILRNGKLSASLGEEDLEALNAEIDYFQLKDHILLQPTTTSPNWEWYGGLKQHDGRRNWHFVYSRGTIGCDAGIREWILCVGESTRIRVGISLDGMEQYSDNDRIAYKLSCDQRMIWSPVMLCYLDHDLDIRPKSHVSIRLDMDKHELTFGVNGKRTEPIPGIAQRIWYPCVGLSVGSSVTIIQ